MCINISVCTGCHCPRWPLGKQTWRQGQETSPHILCLLDMCDKFVKEKHCEKHFKTRPPHPQPPEADIYAPPPTFVAALPRPFVICNNSHFFPVQLFNFKVATSFGKGGGLFLQSSRSQTAKPRHRRRRDVITARGYKSQTAAIRS